MRFAEVFLRLGSALVAWMLLFTHFLWLAALHAMGCGPDGAEMHKLLLGLIPLTCGASLLIGVTQPFAEIHALLRWLTIPLLLLLPFALRSVWDVVQTVNIDGAGVCAGSQPAVWAQLWAPAQVITLALALFMILRGWRRIPGSR
jgi:hypothetical protein